MTFDDPITLLKQHHRAALDHQAELATEARHLAARTEQVRTELQALQPVVRAYGAVLGLMTAATTSRGSQSTTGINQRNVDTPREPTTPDPGVPEKAPR